MNNRMLPALFGAAAIAVVLITFGAPFASLLPFAFLLACPLMMIVMMRSMSGSHGKEDHDTTGKSEPPAHQAR